MERISVRYIRKKRPSPSHFALGIETRKLVPVMALVFTMSNIFLLRRLVVVMILNLTILFIDISIG
jgi:hypothetical protein